MRGSVCGAPGADKIGYRYKEFMMGLGTPPIFKSTICPGTIYREIEGVRSDDLATCDLSIAQSPVEDSSLRKP
jgi:hypothetical protein